MSGPLRSSHGALPFSLETSVAETLLGSSLLCVK